MLSWQYLLHLRVDLQHICKCLLSFVTKSKKKIRILMYLADGISACLLAHARFGARKKVTVAQLS